MPRKLVEPTVQLKGRIPASLARDVRILLLDPKTTIIRYGALSALITKLLSDWVNDKKKKPISTKEMGEIPDGSG